LQRTDDSVNERGCHHSKIEQQNAANQQGRRERSLLPVKQ